MQINKETIRKILLIRTDRYGEFILNIPAIRAVREAFPAAQISILLGHGSAEIFSGSPYVDEIIIYDQSRSSGLRRGFEFIRRLKKKKFDLAVIFNPKKNFNIMVFLAGIPVRLGYDRKWGFLLSQRIKDEKYLGNKHEIEYNLDLVRKIGVDTKDFSLSLPVTVQDEQATAEILAGFGIRESDFLVALHPWTSDASKQWPVENFLALAQEIVHKYHCKILVIGGREEAGFAQEFSRRVAGMVNLAGKLTLKQAAACLKRCKVLVSNDSGPVHLAACVNTPVVTVFKNAPAGKGPVRWGPLSIGSRVITGDNLADIKPDKVLSAVEGVLN